MKQLFLKADQEKANKEMDCHDYLVNLASQSYANYDFEATIAYHENIIRSLKELAKMKAEKEMYDKAWLLLKQIESEKQKKELLYNLQVNIYE